MPRTSYEKTLKAAGQYFFLRNKGIRGTSMDIKLLEMEVGGSWVKFSACNQKGKALFSTKQESVPLPKIPLLLCRILKEKKIYSVKTLKVGSRGVWTKKEKHRLEEKLKPFAKKVIVLSDVEFTYQKIFGYRAGILLIAGTGSIAYGKDGKSRFARAGGLGATKGDEGSGYWIGKQWLMSFLCETAHRKSGSLIAETKRMRFSVSTKSHKKNSFAKNRVRQIAALATRVIARTKKGDVRAKYILNSARKELVNLVSVVYKKLGFRERVPLALYGGLFDSKYFKKGFLKELQLTMGGRFRVANWQ